MQQQGSSDMGGMQQSQVLPVPRKTWLPQAVGRGGDCLDCHVSRFAAADSDAKGQRGLAPCSS